MQRAPKRSAGTLPGTTQSPSPTGYVAQDHPWLYVLPNALSAARLALAAVFPFLPAPWLLPVVVVGALSDGVDGFLARRYGATSWQGGILDAIADKAFTITVLVTFAFSQTLSWWELAALLSRDFVVVGTSLVLAVTARWDAFPRMTSRLAGKATTVVLFFLMIALLRFPPGVVQVLVGLGIAASLAAAADYGQSYERLQQDANPSA